MALEHAAEEECTYDAQTAPDGRHKAINLPTAYFERVLLAREDREAQGQPEIDAAHSGSYIGSWQSATAGLPGIIIPRRPSILSSQDRGRQL